MKIIKNRVIISLCIFLLFIAIIYTGLGSINSTGDELALEALNDAIIRSCSHSYATTGAYPTSIEDLTQRYGLQIDEDKYIVHYEAFASNIMPTVYIFPL